ncbi:WhiB family transcriptional regulator [Corynebacterium striatum]|uniref:WhiB family transcriptional regulator n=1 Tax=Corynebacterium striatum TaxID=43770 RepID=UPI003B5C293C
MPKWHDLALCAQPGQDARDWDATYLPGQARRDKETNCRAAAALCAGCPVMRDCAAEGLEMNAGGVTRAGIPLTHQKLTAGERLALQLMASGETDSFPACQAGGLCPGASNA